MTSLALRLYSRMQQCACHFETACSQCQLDLRALKLAPKVFSNMAEIERNFRGDMRRIEEVAR